MQISAAVWAAETVHPVVHTFYILFMSSVLKDLKRKVIFIIIFFSKFQMLSINYENQE